MEKIKILRAVTWVLYACVFAGASTQAAWPTVVLQTHIQPPYQQFNGTNLEGSSLDTLQCIFQNINVPYAINIAPRARNRELVKSQKVDGFFLSDTDWEMNLYSRQSEPIALERWSYFSLSPNFISPLPEGISIGVIRGSNEDKWLQSRGINPALRTHNLEALIKSLKGQRVETILTGQKSMSRMIASLDEPTKVTSQFARYAPLSVYFSNTFLMENAGFLDLFNKTVTDCRPESLVLEPDEKQYVTSLAQQIRQKYGSLLSQYRHTQFFDDASHHPRHKQDAEWKNAVLHNRTTPIISEILENSLSSEFRKIADENSFITEIFLTDPEGFIIGMNEVTSDYWQGDEAQFLEMIDREAGAVHVSELEFDFSTRKFQVKVSLAVNDKPENKKSRILIIGFDVDKTFAEQKAE